MTTIIEHKGFVEVAVSRGRSNGPSWNLDIKVRGEHISNEIFRDQEDALHEARKTLEAYSAAGYTAYLQNEAA
jgi:hypothetical protein